MKKLVSFIVLFAMVICSTVNSFAAIEIHHCDDYYTGEYTLVNNETGVHLFRADGSLITDEIAITHSVPRGSDIRYSNADDTKYYTFDQNGNLLTCQEVSVKGFNSPFVIESNGDPHMKRYLSEDEINVVLSGGDLKAYQDQKLLEQLDKHGEKAKRQFLEDVEKMKEIAGHFKMGQVEVIPLN